MHTSLKVRLERLENARGNREARLRVVLASFRDGPLLGYEVPSDGGLPPIMRHPGEGDTALLDRAEGAFRRAHAPVLVLREIRDSDE